MSGEIRDTRKMCSLCCAGDYRRCACPWHKPFSEWPKSFLSKLRTQIGT